jgi:hypothetical protein
LETGEDESRNGFLNFTPQKSTDKSTLLTTIVPPSSFKGSEVLGSPFRVGLKRTPEPLNPEPISPEILL